MSKLVTNDNLKAYHAELAGHIKLLQRNTAYVLDDIVNYDGITLKCTTAGTTNTTKPSISSLAVGSTYTDGTCVWTIIDPDKRGIDYWASSTTYALNDQVVNDNKIYKCSTTHTSTSTFDATKWTEISAGGSGGISIWQANTDYEVNDVVIDSNLIWQCATAHTSTATFDESKWVCISGGEISNGLEIVDLWSGTFSFDNSTQGSAPTSSTPMVTLSESMDNFEYLYVVCKNSIDNFASAIIPVEDISLSGSAFRAVVYATGSYSVSAEVKRYDSTHLYIYIRDVLGWSEGYLTSVQGIRKAKPIVSSGMKYETLWEGEAGDSASEGAVAITLNENVKGYKKIGLSIKHYRSSTVPRPYYREISVNDYIDFIENMGSDASIGVSHEWYSVGEQYVEITHTNSDYIQFNVNYKNSVVTKVIGISEGVVVPTGVQAARVTLFEGVYTGTSQQLLSDSIANYDQLEFTFDAKNTSTDTNKTVFMGNVSDIKDFDVDVFRFSIYVNSNSWSSVDVLFSDLTHFYCLYWGSTSWSNPAITRVVGIKYIQPDSYSTEEKLIGTWIDGKPLYQKTIAYTSTFYNGWTTVYTFDIDITPVDIKATVHNITMNVIFPMATITNDIDFMISYNHSTRAMDMYVRRQSDAWNNAYITVQYTKN